MKTLSLEEIEKQIELVSNTNSALKQSSEKYTIEIRNQLSTIIPGKWVGSDNKYHLYLEQISTCIYYHISPQQFSIYCYSDNTTQHDILPADIQQIYKKLTSLINFK